MKLSREWLSDYIDLSGLSDADLAARLTEIGHAIDAVETHGDDTVFDIEFTANRIDAMSHLGTARELAAALGREVRFPGVEATAKPAGEVAIRIDAPALCDRYTGQVIHGVTVKPSSPKIARRLESIGLRPINNVVDATNYVMMAVGHPLHAFDMRDVHGNQIVVRAAKNGEKLTTLDGVERTLDEETTVIADGERGVAIGGIMGGANSEIRGDTKDVLLECAHFHAPSIRKAARRMGMKTDASYRFERNVDPNDTIQTARLCAELIVREAGGTLGDLVDVVAAPIAPKTIVLREEKLEEMSAGVIGAGYALDLFRRIGMTARAVAGGIEVVVPTYRGDIGEEIDLIEEVLRFYGYDRIPASLPRVTSGDESHEPVSQLEESMRDLLVGAGLAETINYAFIHPDHNRLFSEDEPWTVTNALTENISSMRLSLAPGLLSTIAFNRSYGTRDGGLFEIGRTYHRHGKDLVERPRAAMALFGQSGGAWGEARRAWDFFDLKGIVETVAGRLRAGLRFEPHEAAWIKPGTGARATHEGREVALAGSIARGILDRFELKGEVLFAEIDLAAFGEGREAWKMKPVSRFPGVPMVLAMMHAPDLRYERIVEAIRKLDAPYLEEVGLWDRFVPQGSAEVKTALGMWYQAFDRSLTQEEVAEIHRSVAERIAAALPVRLIG